MCTLRTRFSHEADNVIFFSLEMIAISFSPEIALGLRTVFVELHQTLLLITFVNATTKPRHLCVPLKYQCHPYEDSVS